MLIRLLPQLHNPYLSTISPVQPHLWHPRITKRISTLPLSQQRADPSNVSEHDRTSHIIDQSSVKITAPGKDYDSDMSELQARHFMEGKEECYDINDSKAVYKLLSFFDDTN